MKKSVFCLLVLCGVFFLTSEISFAQRPIPGEMRNPLGGNRSSPDTTASKFSVQITVYSGVMKVGQSYTLFAQATGGNSPYQYRWTGINSSTGTNKATRFQSRKSVSASFRRPGVGVITVYAIDDKNRKAQATIRVKVIR